MFETGMSALVLKICSEYAKSLGLNFPPCTQQEINAICEWVDKHTIKDVTMEQNGDSITFKFVTENDTTKEFTFSIAEQLNGKLDKPATPTAESAVILGTDGIPSTKPLSEIGGEKWYRHNVEINNIKANTNDSFHMSFLSRSKDSTTNITQIVTNEGFTEIVSLIGDIKITTDSAVTVFPLATSRGVFRGIIYSNKDNSTSVYSIHYMDLNVNNAGQGNVPAGITHVDTVIKL